MSKLVIPTNTNSSKEEDLSKKLQRTILIRGEGNHALNTLKAIAGKLDDDEHRMFAVLQLHRLTEHALNPDSLSLIEGLATSIACDNPSKKTLERVKKEIEGIK